MRKFQVEKFVEGAFHVKLGTPPPPLHLTAQSLSFSSSVLTLRHKPLEDASEVWEGQAGDFLPGPDQLHSHLALSP